MTQSDQNQSCISVLLIGDYVVARHGIRSLLEQDSHINVVGEAGDKTEAIALLKETQPDVAIIETSISDSGALELLTASSRASRSTKSLILGTDVKNGYFRQAVKLGARGFLTKGADGTELTRTIHLIWKGNLVFPSEVANAIPEIVSPVGEVTGSNEEMSNLTHREVEVLERIAKGSTNRAIAQELDISPRTVDSHVRRILTKLGAKNRTDAARVSRAAFSPAF